MRRLLLLSLAAAALAGGDAARTYDEEAKKARNSEKRFFEDFQRSWNDAFLAFREPIEAAEAKPLEHTDAVWDFAAVNRLYAEAAAIQEARGRAALEFARSGHPKAATELLQELLDLVREAEALEAELAEAKPIQRAFLFDLRPAVRRHALAARERLLVEAVGSAAGAAGILADAGLREAAAKDGRKSVARRVAVIDALGFAGGDGARAAVEPFLRARESSLRIAALEACARLGGASTPALLGLLSDPSPPVLRALLDAVRTSLAKEARFLPPIVAGLEGARGSAAVRSVAALEALTRQKFGHDPARWREWLSVYAGEIEAGTFDAGKIEVQELPPKAPEGAMAFLGVTAPAAGAVFVLDASLNFALPADLAFQLTKYKTAWPTGSQSWQSEHPAHRTVILRELLGTIDAMPKEAPFHLVALHGAFEAEALSGKKPLRAGKADRAAVEKFVERLPARGWCAPYEGICEAMRLMGLPPGADDFGKPNADTIFLVHAGAPAGGRYMSPDAAIEAFRRLNRFRRVTVHAIRICDDKEAGEKLMCGIAEASGGSYLHRKAP